MSFIKSFKRHPVLSFFLVAVVLFQGYSIWQSKGPTLIIETLDPAEDILVLCTWHKEGLFFGGHSTGNYRSDYKVIVTESNKKVSCGWSIWGGSSGLSSMHPIYMGDSKNSYMKEGVKYVVYNKTKLDYLDEQKAKFEAGYWDKNRWPGSKYADSVKGICWFPHQYFDYYRQKRRITLEHFKSIYYEPVLQCYKRVVPILRKYDKSYKNMKDAEEYVKGFWKPEKWEQFND